MRLKYRFCFVAFLLMSSPSYAMTDDIIEGAKLCTRNLPRYEHEYAIPTHLLSAIAATESGRFHDGLGMNIPWPWTITTGKKKHWFETKEEAIKATEILHSKGQKHIGIGCMNIDMDQHPDAFSSLQEAFNPQSNVAFAGEYLRQLYDKHGTWKKAAMFYKTNNVATGSAYVGQVYDNWYQIINKLRAARLDVPEDSVYTMEHEFGDSNKFKDENELVSGKMRRVVGTLFGCRYSNEV